MLNRFTLQGRLTSTPELRRTSNGTAVSSFTVAWSQKYKDAEQKLFMPCVAWRQTAEGMSKWFSKGQELVVDGYLTSRKWQDKNGNDRETIELNVDRVHFCGPKKDGQSQNTGTTYSPAPPGGNNDFAEIGDESGDLPF